MDPTIYYIQVNFAWQKIKKQKKTNARPSYGPQLYEFILRIKCYNKPHTYRFHKLLASHSVQNNQKDKLLHGLLKFLSYPGPLLCLRFTPTSMDTTVNQIWWENNCNLVNTKCFTIYKLWHLDQTPGLDIFFYNSRGKNCTMSRKTRPDTRLPKSRVGGQGMC